MIGYALLWEARARKRRAAALTAAAAVTVATAGLLAPPAAVAAVTGAHGAAQPGGTAVTRAHGAPRITVTPGSVTATTRMGHRSTVTVTLRNTGTAPGTVTISQTWPSGFTPLGAQASKPGTPLRRIRGHFDPDVAHPPSARQAPRSRAAAAGAGDGPWLSLANYPAALNDEAAATDPATGDVYTVGGIDISSNAYAAAYVLDPAAGRWKALPALSHARAGAQAAFVDGRLIVTGGYDNNLAPVPYTEIYDPALGRWSSGASIPHAYYGAAAAVLDGKLYVVGGCDIDYNICGENDVQVYNPASGQWTTAAPYPARLGWLACGAIDGQLYCAGGVSDLTGSTSAGYVYNPRLGTWSSIPHMPIDLWGSAYAAANGQLLVSGGVTGGQEIVTNQGYAYNPAADGWSPLPNAPGDPVYSSASACGLYRIGGNDGDLGEPVDKVAELPGYGGCGGPPWLSASPSTLTLSPGQAATVTVTLNAASPSVTQPGTYTATLGFSAGAPYPEPRLAARLTATPPSSWGELAGIVTGRACDGSTRPLPGATVQVDGRHGTWTPATGRDGRYRLWLDDANSPATLIVSQPGWQPQTATAPIKPLAATTRDFTLIPVVNKGCDRQRRREA